MVMMIPNAVELLLSSLLHALELLAPGWVGLLLQLPLVAGDPRLQHAWRQVLSARFVSRLSSSKILDPGSEEVQAFA